MPLWGSIDRCHVWLGFTTGRDVSYVCQRRSCESAGPERTHACFYSNRDVARKVDAFETRSGLNPESDPSNPESRVRFLKCPPNPESDPLNAPKNQREGFARVRLEIRDCKRRRRLVGRVRCLQLSCSTLWGSIDRCHVRLGFTTGRDVSYVCQRASPESDLRFGIANDVGG